MSDIVSLAREFTLELIEQFSGIIDIKGNIPKFLKRKLRIHGFYEVIEKNDFETLLKVLYEISKACPAISLMLLFHNVSLDVIKNYSEYRNLAELELTIAIFEPTSRTIDDVNTTAENLGDKYKIIGVKSPVINVDADYFLITAREKKKLCLAIVDSSIISDLKVYETFGLRGLRIGIVRFNGEIPYKFVKDISMNFMSQIVNKIFHGLLSITCSIIETLTFACKDFLGKRIPLDVNDIKNFVLSKGKINEEKALMQITENTMTILKYVTQIPHAMDTGCTMNKLMRDLFYLNFLLHVFSVK